MFTLAGMPNLSVNEARSAVKIKREAFRCSLASILNRLNG
jgi:hypothetical protein